MEAVAEQSPSAPLAGVLLQGGGGCLAHPLTSGPPVPSNLHECYWYIFVYEYMYKYPASPPPPGMGNLTDVWGTPPPLCEIFCSTVLQHYFFRGMLCPLTCYTAD